MQNRLDNELDVSKLTGLSDQEAANRLKTRGYNELPSSKPRSVLAMAFEVVREPMFLLLIASGAIYLVLGDVEEALILLSFVFVIIAITIYQEHKTERALEALRDLSSPRALVIRGGQQKRIAGREVVPDDIILLAEGDRVALQHAACHYRSMYGHCKVGVMGNSGAVWNEPDRTRS